jgi:antitoxin (DNA-binding transcriptional repressor) of toxin-antitoxin stability system
MKAVGVKKLKAKLSEYLRSVKAGETLLVTDRDEVIAEIRPVSGRLPPHDDVEDVLDGLAQAGEVQRARTSKGDWTWQTCGLGLPGGTAAKVLDELRSDRSPSD